MPIINSTLLNITNLKNFSYDDNKYNSINSSKQEKAGYIMLIIFFGICFLMCITLFSQYCCLKKNKNEYRKPLL